MDVLEDTSRGNVQSGQRSARQPRSFEDVFIAMGPPGRYQLVQIIMLLTCIFPMTFGSLKYVFISILPDFVCSAINETEVFEKLHKTDNNTFPLSVSYNDSSKIQILRNKSGTWEKYKTIHCINGYDYVGGKDVSFVTEWDLVCDQEGIPELAQTVNALGGFVGSIFFNVLADDYGRWKTIVSSTILTTAAEIATAFAPEIYSFLTLRFFAGLFGSGMYISCYVMIIEMITSKYRVMMSMVGSALWSLGVVMLSGIAYAFRNYSWRELQLYTGIICSLPLFFMYFINESASWLYSVGDKPRVEKIIEKACKTNGVNYNLVKEVVDECFQDVQVQHDVVENIDTKGESNNALGLLKSKKYLIIVGIAWFSFFTNEAAYSGFYLTASTLVGNFYLNIAVLALVGVPGAFINWVSLKFKGRRFMTIAFIVMTIICLLISTFILDANIDMETANKVSLSFFILGKFAISSCYNTLFLYIPEIFPTCVRTTGFGISSTGATVGACVAPYLLPFKQIVSWGPGTFLAACCCLTVLLLLKLPETKGKQLVIELNYSFITESDNSNDDEDSNDRLPRGKREREHTHL